MFFVVSKHALNAFRQVAGAPARIIIEYLHVCRIANYLRIGHHLHFLVCRRICCFWARRCPRHILIYSGGPADILDALGIRRLPRDGRAQP
eukprot:217612-Pyramimonas_sp.AAC.1